MTASCRFLVERCVAERGEFVKKRRHERILELIREMEIGTQEELAVQLQKSGFQVTQATVSRDIKELMLTKVPAQSGKYRYAVPDMDRQEVGDSYLRILKEGFVSMDMAQNILVVKTGAGLAMAVAAALDALNWHEIVGSIAGDDTVMCAVRSVEQTKTVMERLLKIVR